MSAPLLVLRNAACGLRVYRTSDRATALPRGMPHITIHEPRWVARGVVLSEEAAVEIAHALLDGRDTQWGSLLSDRMLTLRHDSLGIHPLSFPLTKESREAIAATLFETVMQP